MKTLCPASVSASIDRVLESCGNNKRETTDSSFSENGIGRLRIRRIVTSSNRKQDIPSLPETISTAQGTSRASGIDFQSIQPLSYCFGLVIYSGELALASRRDHDSQNDSTIGIVTCYLGYSTWDGRCLFVDKIRLNAETFDRERIEPSILRILAKIAVELECSRLNWKTTDAPRWYTLHSPPPEILHDWCVLTMDRTAMKKYVGRKGAGLSDTIEDNFRLDRRFVEKNILESIRTACVDSWLRLATSEDADTIFRLVNGLAEYEKEPDAVNVTPSNYIIDGLDRSNEPLFYCLLLEDPARKIGNGDRYAYGMAFFYLGCDWRGGKFLYLEDLYLEPAYRKKGKGSATMQYLARLSLVLGCVQFTWVALTWNTPALNLYEKIGATRSSNQQLVRFTGENLNQFVHG